MIILYLILAFSAGWILCAFFTSSGRQSDLEFYQEGIFYRDTEIRELKDKLSNKEYLGQREVATAYKNPTISTEIG
jgi:hypothetical protein